MCKAPSWVECKWSVSLEPRFMLFQLLRFFHWWKQLILVVSPAPRIDLRASVEAAAFSSDPQASCV